jgi:hypothetical protein
MELLFGALLGINGIGIVAIIFLTTRNHMWAHLLYPVIEDILKMECGLNDKWCGVVKVVFTIMFLPVLLFYFICLTAYITVMGIFAIIREIIEENKKK